VCDDIRKVNVVKNIRTGRNHIIIYNRVLCGYKPYNHEIPEKLDVINVTCATCRKIYGLLDTSKS
jgi:hypothetical protein